MSVHTHTYSHSKVVYTIAIILKVIKYLKFKVLLIIKVIFQHNYYSVSILFGAS